MSDNRPLTPDLEARFDAELSRAARALATEELPRGILDAGLSPAGGGATSVRARRSVPAYAGLVAILMLLLATAIALVPGGIPPVSPTPPAASAGPTAAPSPSQPGSQIIPGTFRTTSAIRADYERLGYACRVGSVLLPTGPSPSAMTMEGAICSAPAEDGPYTAAVIVGETRDGRIVEVHVKASLTGVDTAAARAAVAVPLAKAVAIAASGEGVGDQLAEWVLGAVPSLTLNDSDSTKLAGFVLKVARSSDGGYQLVMFEEPAFP
jgi:hypothetical protein